MYDADEMRGAPPVGSRLARSMDFLVRRAIRPLVSRAPGHHPPNPNGRRFCIIHLDGLSRPSLMRAVELGWAPFLGSLMRSRGFQLSPCWSGAPASTPAFQAGLLYGAREADIPGFLWYDRQTQREVRMDRADDAARVEASLATAAPGLLSDGATSFSVFTGGAKENGLTMAGWAEDEETRLVSSWDLWHLAASTVAHSLTFARILGRFLREGSVALVDLFRQARLVGRFQHELTFLMHRVELAVGAREAATWGAVLDMARGVPALYVCFADYDEIAHRRGPDSEAAMVALWGIDRAVAALYAAAAAVPQLKYDLYVLSDHGQVVTRPFEQAQGLGLVDYLTLAQPRADGAPYVPDEAAQYISRFRTLERAAQAAVPKGLKSRAREAALEAARALAHSRNESESLALLDEVTCIDAGDVAHIYFGREGRPLLFEEVQARYRRHWEVLVRCPSVGYVTARGGRGGLVWRQGERFDLGESADVARLSARAGSREVVDFLAAMLRIPSAGDLVAYGNGLPGGDVAFAWEFGSHAGVGLDEVETFVIHPAAAGSRFDFRSVHHGADLHRFFTSTYGLGAAGPAGWRLH